MNEQTIILTCLILSIISMFYLYYIDKPKKEAKYKGNKDWELVKEKAIKKSSIVIIVLVIIIVVVHIILYVLGYETNTSIERFGKYTVCIKGA